MFPIGRIILCYTELKYGIRFSSILNAFNVINVIFLYLTKYLIFKKHCLQYIMHNSTYIYTRIYMYTVYILNHFQIHVLYTKRLFIR